MKNDSGRLKHRSLTEMTIVTLAILYNLLSLIMPWNFFVIQIISV